MAAQPGSRRISLSTGERKPVRERKVTRDMSTFERRMHFERLRQLRALYRLRGDWDSVSAISIDDAIACAVQVLSRGLHGRGPNP
jgi:hypothetical protein